VRIAELPPGLPKEVLAAHGREVAFIFEGETLTGYAGEPIAVSLWARGIRVLGRHEVDGRPRGLYCAIGHCFECRLRVNGVDNVRACLTPLSAGMVVERQSADRPPGEHHG